MGSTDKTEYGILVPELFLVLPIFFMLEFLVAYHSFPESLKSINSSGYGERMVC